LAESGEVVVSPVFSDCISGTKLRTFISVIHHGIDKITLVANSAGFGAIARLFVKKPEEIARSRAITHRVEGLGLDSLKEYRRLIALYCHPVVRAGGIFDQKTLPEMKQQKRCLPDEPEMRNVFVAFLNAALPLHRSTDIGKIDKPTVQKINRILNLVSRELLHFRGYVESFIDDKGFSLMITFGLRGSMFPNLVPNVALPAVINVMDVLSSEANVSCRMGSTFGNVHCGLLGANERHEYTVLGPSVNLAARLMTSELNHGLLVDESVRNVPGGDFSFERIGTVAAKGYARNIETYSPVLVGHVDQQPPDRPNSFVGRALEIDLILHEAKECSIGSKMVFLAGATGMGKSTLLARASTVIAEKAEEGSNKRIRLERLYGNSKTAKIPFAALGAFLDTIQKCHLMSSCRQHGLRSSPTRPTNILELFGIAYQDLHAAGDEALNDLPLCISQVLAYCFQDVDLLVIAIDDCHRLDKYSWRTLVKLMESTKGVFILAATTTLSPRGFQMDERTESLIFDTFQQDGRLSMLELDNFTFQEVETLVVEALKLGEVPRELLQNIYAESGGRPLFVKQVLDRLQGSEKHEQCADILLHRLDCLQFSERRCLTIAACLGNVFCLEDVEHILLDDTTGGDEAIPCAATLDVLVRSGIICSHVTATPDDNKVINKNDNKMYAAAGTGTATSTFYGFRDDRWRKKILEVTLKSAQQDVSRRVATRQNSGKSARTVKR
jgi:energy-coupling factor transporter ATP-binding protein EcfA2